MSRTTFILCCLPKCPTLPAATLSMPSGAFCLPEFQDFLCFSSPMLSEQDLPCDYGRVSSYPTPVLCLKITYSVST